MEIDTDVSRMIAEGCPNDPPEPPATSRPTRVYVASSWRNKLQPAVVSMLRHAGLDVFDPRAQTHCSAWREIYPGFVAGLWTNQQWREALRHDVATAGYAGIRGGMDWADVCVLVLPCGRSAHLEAGFMAGQGKRVITFAIDPVEPELMSLLLGSPDEICTTCGELFRALGVQRLR